MKARDILAQAKLQPDTKANDGKTPISELIKQIEKEDEGCNHCAIHSLASVIPPKVECAWCGGQLDDGFWDHDHQGVGQFNFFDANEDLYNAVVHRCSSCNKETAYLPTRVGHNGNHDTYYTGGPNYVNDTDWDELREELRKKIRKSTEQFIARLEEKGLPLDIWVMYDAEAALADFLHKKGYKR